MQPASSNQQPRYEVRKNTGNFRGYRPPRIEKYRKRWDTILNKITDGRPKTINKPVDSRAIGDKVPDYWTKIEDVTEQIYSAVLDSVLIPKQEIDKEIADKIEYTDQSKVEDVE